MANDFSTISFGNQTFTVKDSTARTELNKKININQGTNNAGKFLIVNSQGNVEPVSIASWQGGSY